MSTDPTRPAMCAHMFDGETPQRVSDILESFTAFAADAIPTLMALRDTDDETRPWAVLFVDPEAFVNADQDKLSALSRKIEDLSVEDSEGLAAAADELNEAREEGFGLRQQRLVIEWLRRCADELDSAISEWAEGKAADVDTPADISSLEIEPPPETE